MSPPRYWIVVVSKDHLEIGKKLGIVQANHGKAAPMKRLQAGDYIVFYAPKIVFGGKEPYQKFVAIARVKPGEVYQGDMGSGFVPYRRDVEFLPTTECDIRSVLDQLSFIPDKKYWGFMFRFGFFEIPAIDFERIATQMKK